MESFYALSRKIRCLLSAISSEGWVGMLAEALGRIPQISWANFSLNYFLSSSVISNCAPRRSNLMHDVTIFSDYILNF